MRLVGALFAEQDDEWQVSDRRYFSTASMAKIDALEGGEDPRELLAAIARGSEDGGDESPPLDGTRPSSIRSRPLIRAQGLDQDAVV